MWLLKVNLKVTMEAPGKLVLSSAKSQKAQGWQRSASLNHLNSCTWTDHTRKLKEGCLCGEGLLIKNKCIAFKDFNLKKQTNYPSNWHRWKHILVGRYNYIDHFAMGSHHLGCLSTCSHSDPWVLSHTLLHQHSVLMGQAMGQSSFCFVVYCMICDRNKDASKFETVVTHHTSVLEAAS